MPSEPDDKMIFHAAGALPTAAERDAYLDKVCGVGSPRRARIAALLQASECANSLLDPLLDESRASPEVSDPVEGPGTVIGWYKLLERIGEGGMAVVYMAEQERPIRRRVALKIIKLGMDTKQVIARFEAERQALAMMDHPNIAKVLDAGATETGRPYFVMELVQGVSVTEYCDTNRLNTKDRLALFVQVCQAVQHAHQKGIIHRDIKPSNVMVTHHDGRPVPKVIDFGIAKAINQKLTEKTLFTRYAHLIGTPAYMSPEQAELSDVDIDTRSDIYSLGVLLYELLTGTTPFSEEELRKAGYVEMQRVIREQEPVKPSTRIKTALRSMGVPPMSSTGVSPVNRKQGQACPERSRGNGPATHGQDAHATGTPMLREVRGDLDWIVMKTLEKDRSRRYDTASSLAEDIRRHLEHEPVLARGPGTGYRLRKFLRRHRSQVLAALVLAVAAGGVVVGLSQWSQGRRRLAEAEDLRHQAEGLRHKDTLSQAREQYAKADRDAALETLKPILTSKHVGSEAQLLQATILVDSRQSDEATIILNGLLDEPPVLAGTAHALLARILWESGTLDTGTLEEIEEHRRQAQALLPETAEAYFLRAMTALTIKDQLTALDKALQLDPRHYESRRLRGFTYYASRKYERLNEDAYVMETLRDPDPLGHSLRAIALRDLGRGQEALTEYDEALRLTPEDDPQHLDLLTQRSETLLGMDRYEDVVATAPEAINRWPDRPVFRYHLFCALTALGDYDKADAVFREIVRSAPTARNAFWVWATKYVFDTLEAERLWHPADSKPSGAAFLPMIEAEETYRALSAKARRVVAGAFTADWSPDGKKLAFSPGVRGYRGVALYDPGTKETELLIVPGKDPRWSPDGRYLAFVRDCQAMRLEELTSAEPGDRERSLENEEVWVMKSDGTEPRRLARGGWPSWSRDSGRLYFQSRLDKALCSISLAGAGGEPQRIMACADPFPSVSPDEQHVAYLENKSLKIKNIVSRAVVAQWQVLLDAWGVPTWSATGQELCLGAGGSVGDRTGMWIYRLDCNEPVKVLSSQIMTASWASDGTKLAFTLGLPYVELWTASLDPALSTVKALGPGQTLAEHWRQTVRLCTRRIETDPLDAVAYWDRARCYDRLHERLRAQDDMRRWSAAANGRLPGDFRRVLELPFDCELVFSAERPVNETPILNVAFGLKGRCHMKSFQIPMLSMSLLGLCLLSGLDAPARADFIFGEPVDIQSTFPIDPATEFVTCFSADGLEVYFAPAAVPFRSGGQGGADLWVFTRASVEDAWRPPENLGPIVNTASNDVGAFVTVDGLELYFSSNRPAGYGKLDIYVTRAASRTSPWDPAINLGPEVNGSSADQWPMVSADGLELYLSSDRPGGYGGPDLYVSTRATTDDPWGDSVNVGPAVNSPGAEIFSRLSPDGLLLFFSSDRPGGFGPWGDGYVARRASRSAPWQPAVNLGPTINATTFNWPIVSPDGSALYILRDPNDDMSNYTYKAPILPIVDFDADGAVNLADVGLLIENWGTDDTLYDIGPYAWGDGVVDAHDLLTLAEYMAQNPTADVNDVNDL